VRGSARTLGIGGAARLAWRHGAREQLRIAIITWIERTYRRRRQTALGRLTPIEYEAIMTTPASQAA
jgi:putative transposase